MCREELRPHPALLMMGSDQYCLKWNNHWANLIRVFNSLLQSETFVDVTLACEGRHLKAHRLVLSACSPYFKELLVAHPDKHPIVILKDVRYSELRTLIEFIYNGEVSVEQNDLAALLCTARELQIKGLADNRLPGAHSPPHCPRREVGEVGKYTLTPTTTAALLTSTTHSTSPPLEATSIKSSSPRRKVGSEDRPPPPPLTALHPGLPPSTFCSSQLPPYHSHPTSREASPVHKRRRVSVEGSEEDGEAGEGSKQARTDQPNGHFPQQQEPSERQYTLASSSSGIRPPDPTRREDNNNTPSSWDTDKASPSITKISVGVAAAATTSTTTSSPGETKATLTCDDEDDDRAHVTIQSPEVILEEGEIGVVSSGPPSSVPSPPLASSSLGNTSITAAALGGPLTPSGPLPPQMALLHQALALGYHPLQHYFPPGLLEQQQQQHPGVSPPKDIIHILDMMKALPPSARLPLALGGPSAVGGTSSLGLGLPVVTGTTTTSTASISTNREKNVGSGITCHICAMILPSAHHLEEHIRIHEEEKPYKCDQCGQRYKYQSAFQRHQEQNHTAKLPGDKPFRCSVCGQCFKYHKSFTKHRSNHDALDRIMKAESEEGGRLLHRGIHESYLQKLLVSESSKSESETSVTLKEESLENQQQEEGAERPSTSNPTTFNATLLHSVNPENGVKNYEDRDEEEEEGEPEGEEEEGEYEEESKGKFVYCVKCKLTFRDVASFEGHCRGSTECSLDTLREVNVGEGPGLSRPPSVASSPQASPRLSPSSISGPPRSPIPASTPLAMPSPPATTTPIGGLPPSASVAMSTATASTTSVTPGTSTPPGQNTLFKLEPRGAIMLPHAPLPAASDPRGDEERPFKCQFCQKGFKGRENLKLHIRTHTGEKPYNCGVCGKAFGGRSDMNRHLRIHTGEKPYPCKVCGKKFARADYLSKHITTHLGVPFAKPVHSLQQSLQNLENMQNLQNLHKLQNMSNE